MLPKSRPARLYVIRLFVLMVLYGVALVAANALFRAGVAHGVAAYVIAILPALPLIGIFWAVMRFIIEEEDEFMRLLLVRQCLVATGFCLVIVTAREWLQNFDVISSDDQGFGAAFFWFIGLGVGAVFNSFTMGTSGRCN